MVKYLFFSISVVSLSVPAVAQEEVEDNGWGEGCCLLTDPRILEETITVTATGTRGTVVSSGQAITVIGQQEIEAVQGADLTRILERSPGVTISRNGGTGSFTGLRLRGSEAEQVLAVVDGVRVADVAAPSGGFDFGTLLALDLSKIEVLRNSNSTIWGSDAIGGVVVASTRTETGLRASSEFGGKDSASLSATGGVADEDVGYLGLSGTYFRTDGISAADGGAEADGFRQWAVNGQGRLYVSQSLELFARARLAQGDLDIDGFPAPAYLLADTLETQETRQFTGSTGAVYDSGPLFLSAAYSFADTDRDNFDDSGAASFTSRGRSDRIALRGEWRPFGPFLLHFGGENEWTSYATLYDPGAKTRQAGAYAQGGIEWRGINAHLGARVDDHADFGTQVSFGADAAWEFSRAWRLRASIGEGFKAPTLFQLHSDYGNLALTPEQSTSVDLGVAYGERTMARQPVYAALTLYRRDTDNQIAYASCFGQTTGICTNRPFGTYDNLARTRAQGVEAEVWARPAQSVSLGAAFTFTHAEDRTTGRDLARRPRHSATLTGEWQALDRLQLGADVRIVSDSWDDAFNSVRLDGYELLTLRASFQATDEVEFFGRVENVWDEQYQTAAGYGTMGRAAYVGARLAL
ncbi:MAG: TonB-dependent receptor [Erythrobacter sp.]|nr:TonB-dependent receptor [Erythrobacter sp.]